MENHQPVTAAASLTGRERKEKIEAGDAFRGKAHCGPSPEIFPSPSLHPAARANIALQPLFVFVVFFLLIKYLENTWFGVAQYRLFGWDFFAHLMMVVMPAVALAGARRPPAELGLSRAQLTDAANRRLRLAAFVGIGIIWLVLAARAVHGGYRPFPKMPPLFFAEGAGMAGNLVGWGLTIVFAMVFCGVGEEVLFRGYIQGQLNRALGKRWRFRGVAFGPGLFIAAAVFGIGHGINYYNPLTDPIPRIEWGPAGITAVEGLLFGFLYEATGGIAAPAALHAAIGLFFGAIIFR